MIMKVHYSLGITEKKGMSGIFLTILATKMLLANAILPPPPQP